MATAIDLTTYATDELVELSRSIEAEYQRRRIIETAKEQQEKIAEQYAEAVKAEPAKEFAPGFVVGPGEKLIHGGKEYVNVSGAFLSVSPEDYPLGFQLAEAPKAETVPAWDPNGHSYQVGDQLSYQGTVYKVIQAHTSAAHWTPDTVASLYAKA
ncbi:carbohydrate-binding protein [Rothia sp. LK2588]|uniref:carbohydrate-binding protein n=1 Tax=Rothia sp. LK2588 TaxID=3114369 RepID=UPI0034CE3400